MATRSEWIAGVTVAGVKLPERQVDKARRRHGHPPLYAHNPILNVTTAVTDHKENPTQPPATVVTVPKAGPGTELEKIFKSINIKANEHCPCRAMIDQMNLWGVEGCEENFNKIVSHLDEAQHQFRWTEKIRAAATSVWTGLAFKVDILSPFPALVRMAIENAKNLA